jgi:hypothetical protein
LTPAQGGTSVDVSTSRRGSHNDVFFRKRSEGATSVGDAISSSAPAEPLESAYPVASAVLANLVAVEPVTAEPIAVETPITDPILPEPIEASPALEAPVLVRPEAFVPDPVPEVSLVHEDAEGAQPAVPAVETPANQPAPVVEVHAAVPSPQQGGFLKRMFGRFRK